MKTKLIPVEDIEFFNHLLDLEKEYEESKPHPSKRELVEIFPEATPYLKEKIKKYRQEIQRLIPEIKESLIRILRMKNKDSFTIWFLKEIVRIWKGEKLNFLEKEIKDWSWALKPPNKTKEGIVDRQIQEAKEYPFENLIKVRNNFSLCPFHTERKESFYTKNNFGFCFGCGWKGDTIKFIMDKQNLNFKDAVKYLV